MIRLTGQLIAMMGEINVGLIAAGVGFFSMLALFPAIAAVIAMFGYFADPAIILEQIKTMQEFLPGDAYNILSAQVTSLIAANQSTLGWTSLISILAALWSSRAGVSALIMGLNAIYGAPNRGGVMHILVSVTLTLMLVGVVLVAMAAVIVVPIILAIFPLGPFSHFALDLVKWAISISIVVFGVGLAYRYGPNRTRRSDWLSAGMWLSVGLWAAVSIGFSFYIANFASYNRVYGSIGAVIAMLMWFYVSAYVILVGAALNAVLEREPTAPAAATGVSDVLRHTTERNMPDPLVPPPAPGEEDTHASTPRA